MSEPLISVTRAQLSTFLKDPRAIRAFEKAIKSANVDLPAATDEATIASDLAAARAESAVEAAIRVAEALEAILLAPPNEASRDAEFSIQHQAHFQHDDITPPVQVGTLGQQQSDRVDIRGGTIAGISDLAVADGGTGASTASGACANLAAVHVIAQSGVAVPLTGTLSETTLATVTVPGGALGASGAVRITTLWSNTGSANSKTPRVKFGGTAFYAQALTATVSAQTQQIIRNRGATNSQVSYTSAIAATFGSASGAIVTAAIDTSVDQTIEITGQLANAGETLTLEGYSVEIVRP